MTQWPVISSQQFADRFEEALGPQFNRASMTFENWGPHLSWDVYNLLREAVGMGTQTVSEVLDRCEQHYIEHLLHQHYQLRGINSNDPSDPTFIAIQEIAVNSLGLSLATSTI